MTFRTILAAVTVVVGGMTIGATTSSTDAHAFGTAPAPKPCAQYQWGSKKWKRCRRKNGLPTSVKEQTEEALTLGYALAKAGKFEQALKVLRPEEGSGDPRILTYIGFAERKIGHVDIAMGYYSRALELDPQNAATLSYMGEAYLQKGDVVSARKALVRVASLCGAECAPYRALHEALADFLSKS